MPSEPSTTSWTLPRPPDGYGGDAWAVGADLEPGTLLAAYSAGLFPMRVDGDLIWWSPQRRAVIPVDDYRPSRSTRRAARGFEIRVDTCFREVIRRCADPARPHGWIDQEFIAAYTRLHELGFAHSVEAWDEQGLAGGLYGVATGGLFAAESMTFVRTGASRASVLGLIDLLRSAGAGRLLDVQWSTPHLASLGAVEISRAEYHRRLDSALDLPGWQSG